MSKLMLAASAALLILAPPALAQGKGGDKGGGKGGGGHAAHQGGKPDGGGARDGGGHAARQAARPDRADRGPRVERHAAASEHNRATVDRQRDVPRREEARAGRDQLRGNRGDRPTRTAADSRPDKRDASPASLERGRPNDVRQERVRADVDRGRVIERGRYVRPARLLNGCPPGLARKDNGCLPPGQARKLIPNSSSNLYRYSSWYDDAVRDDWGYWNGYAYRVDPVTHLVAATVPLLGGALYRDAVWPEVYSDYTPDPYYVRYFGYDDDYEYRYADGALFAVRPDNYEIEAVAALLADDPWAVGRPVPIGYSVYNVPPPYRDRYYDEPDAWYRYSDGYVYRIDPATQLVLAAIALLA